MHLKQVLSKVDELAIDTTFLNAKIWNKSSHTVGLPSVLPTLRTFLQVYLYQATGSSFIKAGHIFVLNVPH